jgi:hypothetical protein
LANPVSARARPIECLNGAKDSIFCRKQPDRFKTVLSVISSRLSAFAGTENLSGAAFTLPCWEHRFFLLLSSQPQTTLAFVPILSTIG